MSQETRNKIGLLLFIFLFLLGGCLIVLYVFLGHSWNFAATEIDDVSGNMEEYLVIVYDGTTDPKKLTSTNTGTANKASNSSGVASANANANASNGANVNSNANSSTENSEVDTTSEASASNNDASSTNSNDSSSDSSRGLTGVGERFLRYFNLGTGDSVSEEDATEGSDEDSVMTTEIPEGLQVGDAMAIYRQKRADVLTLYPKNPSHYSEGTVFKKGIYKVGVFGMSAPETYKEVQQKVDSLKAQGATTILAIVSNKNYLVAVDGVDIAIVTQGTSKDMKSYAEDGTLYVESSQIGTLDAIILSPNHIVSTKTL